MRCRSQPLDTPATRFLPVTFSHRTPSKRPLQVLGEWPVLPETDAQAGERFKAAFEEAVRMAGNRNVFIITHGAVSA